MLPPNHYGYYFCFWHESGEPETLIWWPFSVAERQIREEGGNHIITKIELLRMETDNMHRRHTASGVLFVYLFSTSDCAAGPHQVANKAAFKRGNQNRTVTGPVIAPTDVTESNPAISISNNPLSPVLRLNQS